MWDIVMCWLYCISETWKQSLSVVLRVWRKKSLPCSSTCWGCIRISTILSAPHSFFKMEHSGGRGACLPNLSFGLKRRILHKCWKSHPPEGLLANRQSLSAVIWQKSFLSSSTLSFVIRVEPGPRLEPIEMCHLR